MTVIRSGAIIADSIRVIDGDSVKFDMWMIPGLQNSDVRLRLEEVRAPELRHEGGPEAKQFLIDQIQAVLAEGKTLWLGLSDEAWLKPDRRRDDDFGRELGYLMVDDIGETSLNDVMLDYLANRI